MQSSMHSRLLQEALAGQTPSGAAEYDGETGLFLKENQPSEIEVSILCLKQRDNSDGANHIGLTPQTVTIPDCADALEARDCERRSTIPGFRRFKVSTITEIQEAFSEDRQRVSISHIAQVDHSHTRVRLTRTVFEQILRSANIFPALKDIVLHIGLRDTEVEVAPPRARFRTIAETDDLSCTPRGFEIAYGLRFIELNGRSEGKPWSLRQFFVCHKTDSPIELSQWLFFSMPTTVRDQIEPYIGKLQRDIVSHPFDVHVLILLTATRMWRPYLIDLTERMEGYRLRVKGTNLADKNAVQKTGVSMLKVLKTVEVDLLDARLSMLATKDTLTTLQSLLACVSSPGDTKAQNMASDSRNVVCRAMSDQQRDLDLLLDQVDVLLQKSRIISATIANFLSLANGYSMESLAVETHAGAVEAKAQTAIATGDAKAVKALSVIATIYLPVTVVFGFFSTTFMAQDTYDGKPQGNWWLLLAVGLPLTALTMFVWSIWIFRDKFTSCVRAQRGLDIEAAADTEDPALSSDSVNIHDSSGSGSIVGSIGLSLRKLRLVIVRFLTKLKCALRRKAGLSILESSMSPTGVSGVTIACPIKDEKSV